MASNASNLAYAYKILIGEHVIVHLTDGRKVDGLLGRLDLEQGSPSLKLHVVVSALQLLRTLLCPSWLFGRKTMYS